MENMGAEGERGERATDKINSVQLLKAPFFSQWNLLTCLSLDLPLVFAVLNQSLYFACCHLST